MASAIDPTKPTAGTATTESVRANFLAAKTEIEALQEAMSAMPTGVGSLTVVAGEALAEKDIAVLNAADHKAYRARGGSAASNASMATPALYGGAMAYNPATNTVVHIYRDSGDNNTLRIACGSPNQDGSITWGGAVPVNGANMNTASDAALSVCHAGGNRFFTAWRSSATQMSFLAFLAEGWSVSVPAAIARVTTVSQGTGFQHFTSVLYDPDRGRVLAVTPASTAAPHVYAFPAPGDDCAIDTGGLLTSPVGIADIIATASSTASNFVALHKIGDYAVWLISTSSNSSSNYGRTVARVIDLGALTVGAAVDVVSPTAMAAFASAAHENQVFLACTDAGYYTGQGFRYIWAKTFTLDAGGVSIPGGLTARTLLVDTGSVGGIYTASGRIDGIGSAGYDPGSGTLSVTFSRNANNAVVKFYRPATGELLPQGTGVVLGTNLYDAGPFTTSNITTRFRSGSLSHPDLDFAYFGAWDTNSSAKFFAVRPPRPSTLSASTYLGVVADAAVAGAPVTMRTPPSVVSGLSGLVPATMYYAQPDNSFSSVQGEFGVQAGIAISPTQLLLRA